MKIKKLNISLEEQELDIIKENRLIDNYKAGELVTDLTQSTEIIRETDKIDDYIDTYTELDREIIDAEEAVDAVSELVVSDEANFSKVAVAVESLRTKLGFLENRWGVEFNSTSNALSMENFSRDRDNSEDFKLAVESFKTTLKKMAHYAKQFLRKIIEALSTLATKTKRFFTDMGPGIRRLEETSKNLSGAEFNVVKYRHYLKNTRTGSIVAKELGVGPSEIDKFKPTGDVLIEASRKAKRFLKGITEKRVSADALKERVETTLKLVDKLSNASSELIKPLKKLSDDVKNKPDFQADIAYIDSISDEIAKTVTDWGNKNTDFGVRQEYSLELKENEMTPRFKPVRTEDEESPDFISLLTDKSDIDKNIRLLKDLLKTIHSLEGVVDNNKKLISTSVSNLEKALITSKDGKDLALELSFRIANRLSTTSLNMVNSALRELAYAIESEYILVSASLTFFEVE